MISAWGVDHGQVSKGAKEWAIPVVAGATSSVIANQFPQNQTSWQAVRRRKKKKEQIAKLFKPTVVPKYNFKALGKVKLKKGPTFASPTKIDNGFTRSSADAAMWAWERKHIVKSYIPGKGYVPAVKAGKKVLHEAVGDRQKLGYLKRSGWTDDQQMFRHYAKQQHDARELTARLGKGEESWKALSAGRHQKVMGTKVSATQMADTAGGDVGAFAYQTGGRRGARYVVVQPNASEHFIGHETAHVTPKRSSFRMYQISQDKAKLMSEEARASMHGSGEGRYYRNVKQGKAKPADGYVEAAASEDVRSARETYDFGGRLFGGESQWNKRSMDAFRNTQDRIASHGKLPKTAGLKFNGNQWVDNKGNKRGTRTMSNGIRYIGYGVGSTGVGAGAIYASRKADQRAARKARSR